MTWSSSSAASWAGFKTSAFLTQSTTSSIVPRLASPTATDGGTSRSNIERTLAFLSTTTDTEAESTMVKISPPPKINEIPIDLYKSYYWKWGHLFLIWTIIYVTKINCLWNKSIGMVINLLCWVEQSHDSRERYLGYLSGHHGRLLHYSLIWNKIKINNKGAWGPTVPSTSEVFRIL